AQSARCWRQARIVTSRGAVVAAGDKNADPLRRRLLPESVIKSVAAQKLLLTQSETYAHDRRQIVVHNVGRGEVYAVCGSSGTAHHQVHSGPWSHGACPLHVQRGFYRVTERGEVRSVQDDVRIVVGQGKDPAKDLHVGHAHVGSGHDGQGL